MIRFKQLLAGASVLAGVLAGAHPGAPLSAQPAAQTASPFIVEPYLQLGDVPRLSAVETVRLLWQAPDEPGTR